MAQCRLPLELPAAMLAQIEGFEYLLQPYHLRGRSGTPVSRQNEEPCSGSHILTAEHKTCSCVLMTLSWLLPRKETCPGLSSQGFPAKDPSFSCTCTSLPFPPMTPDNAGGPPHPCSRWQPGPCLALGGSCYHTLTPKWAVPWAVGSLPAQVC